MKVLFLYILLAKYTGIHYWTSVSIARHFRNVLRDWIYKSRVSPVLEGIGSGHMKTPSFFHFFFEGGGVILV